MSKNNQIKILLHLIIIQLFLLSYTKQCDNSDNQFLITFHPHLDAFWLNMDTQLKNINFIPAPFLYDMNQRNSKTILNSMLEALWASRERKYFITEAVFFKDWYQYINDTDKQKVKKLLANGQFQLVNGGWVQNDQAVCYYDDILDQYTYGMNYLYQQFGYHIKIGWATDSFGHSHSQAALQHLLGIEFQGIQRVDDRYITQHTGGYLLQFYWQPVSDSNNLTYGGVLNHIRHFLHEVNNFRITTQQEIKTDFEQLRNVMKVYYNKNKLFRFLGNDFQQFKIQQFYRLEQVMYQLNQQNNDQICSSFKYGNPSDYLNLITKYYQKSVLHQRKYDFIPNWDQSRYWVGYFTTDPILKKKCKDFSRLINFYRKSLLTTNTYAGNAQKLTSIEQLLAVMQHHDGITATSKIHIENRFKQRMKIKQKQILQSIQQIHLSSNTIICKFYNQHNQCQIPPSNPSETYYLHIITHGATKKQKLELKLPPLSYYDISDIEEDIFCQNDQQCTIVFQAVLHAGINTYVLQKRKKEDMASKIFMVEAVNDEFHQGKDFKISVVKATGSIKYEFGNDGYYDICLMSSSNTGYVRQTQWWNKYGRQTTKTQTIIPGMYIMANNGNKIQIAASFSNLRFAQGKIFKRFYANSRLSDIKITVKNDEPNIIDMIHRFAPETVAYFDYFLKVSSNIKSNTLYHDSNGFLVSKRILNSRPDYNFTVIPQDRINSNTYPVCSFAYLIDKNKKFLFFTDRTQGVASYQQDLLINIDRLAMDDGKGVGQGYMLLINNTFRYKFGIISAYDNTQRIWQRNYDQALLGYLTNDQSKIIQYRANNQKDDKYSEGLQTSLKYSIFYLNQNQFVLRLQNIAEFSDLKINKFVGSLGSYIWNIEEIGMKLSFFDVKESYANGIVIQNQSKWRKYWGPTQSDTINILNHRNLDGKITLTLRPLQLRSFRINTKSEIMMKRMIINRQMNSQLFQTLSNVKHIKGLRKRCF